MLFKSQKQVVRCVLEKYTWPGAYPVYGITTDGGTLCPDCVKSNIREVVWAMAHSGADRQWEVFAAEVNYEDPDLYCDHCGERIESAYAEEF
jgi:hypothetical protein